MLKWLLTTFLALVLITSLTPWLQRFGLGRLPGDITVRWRGRDVYLPFSTTIVLSGLMMLIGYLI
jgi:hypothetical protein